MHPDLEILRSSPFDQAAFARLVLSARGGNPEALAAFHQLARMPELKQRAVTLLAELKELDSLARVWAEERDPVVGRVLAAQRFVANPSQGMRVEAAVRVTVLTALNASLPEKLWELPERLRVAAVRPLLEACADPELALEACQAMQACPWFELLAEEALRAGCPAEARRQLVLDPRLPEDPGRRAVLHLLRDQFAEAELLDPDGSLLALACQGSDDGLKLEVLARLRSQGRTLEALELLGARSRRGFEEVVSALLGEGRPGVLWDLAFHLPPEQAASLLERLRQAGFEPEERQLWEELTGLLPYRPPSPLQLEGREFSLLGSLVLHRTPGLLQARRALDGRLEWGIQAEAVPRALVPRVIASADGSVLAVAGQGRSGDDPLRDRLVSEPFRFYEGCAGLPRQDLQDIGCSGLAFSPDGNRLAQTRGELVLLHRYPLDSATWTVEEPVLELAFTRDGLAALCENSLLALRPGAPVEQFDRAGLTGFHPPWGASASGEWVAASTRTEVLLTGPEVHRISGRFLELAFDPRERLLLLHRGGLSRDGTKVRSFSQPARAAVFSPDARRMAWLQGDELWVEDLEDRRRSVRLAAPGGRRLEYGQGHLLVSTDRGALVWPTFWDDPPDRLESLGPDYRFAALLARHRHRHALVLDEELSFADWDITVEN